MMIDGREFRIFESAYWDVPGRIAVMQRSLPQSVWVHSRDDLLLIRRNRHQADALECGKKLCAPREVAVSPAPHRAGHAARDCKRCAIFGVATIRIDANAQVQHTTWLALFVQRQADPTD
jgi:hypothetical protein